jgi:hypothetical protein
LSATDFWGQDSDPRYYPLVGCPTQLSGERIGECKYVGMLDHKVTIQQQLGIRAVRTGREVADFVVPGQAEAACNMAIVSSSDTVQVGPVGSDAVERAVDPYVNANP